MNRTPSDEDIDKFKKRLARGESEKSAKAGLKTFENIDGLITTDEGDTVTRRLTDYICPKCGNLLYNTKLDGKHYFCEFCNEQMVPKKIREIGKITDKDKSKKVECVDKKIPGAYKDRTLKFKSKKSTNYICPSCGNMLYDTKNDGVFLYCPKCKMQHNKKFATSK